MSGESRHLHAKETISPTRTRIFSVVNEALSDLFRSKSNDAAVILSSSTPFLAGEGVEEFEARYWGQRYPTIAMSWRRNWDHVVPCFAFPESVRPIIYTTNAIKAPFSPSTTMIRISPPPRFFSSLMARSRNYAPSVCSRCPASPSRYRAG